MRRCHLASASRVFPPRVDFSAGANPYRRAPQKASHLIEVMPPLERRRPDCGVGARGDERQVPMLQINSDGRSAPPTHGPPSPKPIAAPGMEREPSLPEGAPTGSNLSNHGDLSKRLTTCANGFPTDDEEKQSCSARRIRHMFSRVAGTGRAVDADMVLSSASTQLTPADLTVGDCTCACVA